MTDWDALEQLWEYGLSNMLHVDVKEHPLLVADSTHSPSQEPEREKLTEILFETFQPPALYLGRSAVLSAFSAGRSTAVVVDLGAGGTTVTPVYDGFAVQRGASCGVAHGAYVRARVCVSVSVSVSASVSASVSLSLSVSLRLCLCV